MLLYSSTLRKVGTHHVQPRPTQRCEKVGHEASVSVSACLLSQLCKDRFIGQDLRERARQ